MTIKKIILFLGLSVLSLLIGLWWPNIGSFAPYPLYLFVLPLWIGVSISFFEQYALGLICAFASAVAMDQSFIQPVGIFTVSVMSSLTVLQIIWRHVFVHHGFLAFMFSHMCAILMYGFLYFFLISLGAYVIPDFVILVPFREMYGVIVGACISEIALALIVWVIGVGCGRTIKKYFFIEKFYDQRR